MISAWSGFDPLFRELYFLNKMTPDFLVWCYCRFMILFVLSFVLQIVSDDVPAQLWQWHVMAFSPHASMQPCRVEFTWCCYMFMILNLDECAALLYCLVLWQACELYSESIVGTFVYAMLTRVHLTGGNRSGLTGYRSNRSGPVPVSAGTQPAQIQNLNLNSKK